MGYGALRKMARTQVDNAARFITMLVGGNMDGIFSTILDTPVLALSQGARPPKEPSQASGFDSHTNWEGVGVETLGLDLTALVGPVSQGRIGAE